MMTNEYVICPSCETETYPEYMTSYAGECMCEGCAEARDEAEMQMEEHIEYVGTFHHSELSQ